MSKRASSISIGLLALLNVVSTAQAQQGALTKAPRLARGSEATYPPRALRDHVEADVLLELDVAEDGSVRGIAAVATATRAAGAASSTTSAAFQQARDAWGFAASATTAASRLEFEPGESNGVPVPVRIRYTYRFVLPKTELAGEGAGSSTVARAPLPTGRLEGTVRQRGNRMRLGGITVAAVPLDETLERKEAITGADGTFSLELEAGEWSVEASATGFFPLRAKEKIGAGEVVEVAYSIERAGGSAYEVVVRTEAPRREVDRRTLEKAEIVRIPGTMGDPIQAVENMPGVARVPYGGGALIVRGSGPQDSAVFVDGIYVPLIYHFGGLRSVVPGDVIDQIDFFPGNFSTYYGRVTGGVLDARLRRLRPDQIHGALDVSLLDAGAYLEVPIGDDVAILVAGRRSYIDVVLKAALPDDSSVSLVAAPRYYDYQALLDWRIANGHELRLFFFGSDDQLGLLFEQPADLDAQITSGSLGAETFFQRLSLGYRWTASKALRNEARVTIGQDVINASFFGGQFAFDLDNRDLQVRDRATWSVTDAVKIDFGLDLLEQVADVSVKAPRPPKEGDIGANPDLTETLETKIVDKPYFEAAPFVEAEIQLDGGLTLTPGLRVDWFSDVGEVSVDPRISARYAIDEEWTLKGGVGLVHQPPQPQETDIVFGNPELGLQRAVHISAGAEWRPERHLLFDGTIFYKALDELVSGTGALVERDGQMVPQVYDNGGTGRVYGVEVWIKHQLFHNFRGWLTYTLSRAERVDSGSTETRLFDFDQTHILGLIGAYQFPESWELSARYRLVSGNPWTPFAGGVFQSDFDRYVPIPGSVNQDRLPLFHQLDVRLEKRWVYESWQLSAYLSLVNAYNRKNVEGLRYNFDYSESSAIRGLPIFPILGLRGEL